MHSSSSSLSQRLSLHKLNSVIKGVSSPAQPAPEKIGHDTLRQLHDRMTKGEEWQQDESFCQTLDNVLHNDKFQQEFKKDTGQSLPDSAKHLDKTQTKKLMSFISDKVTPAATTSVLPAEPAAQDFSIQARQSLQNIMKNCLQQKVLEILLETGLKLTGMDRSVAETFVPVIKLIREARAILSSGEGSLTDHLKRLTEELNIARNCLNRDTVVFRGIDILCDVADVLHKGLASSDLSMLKAPLEKLGAIPGLDSVVEAVMPLFELGGQLQQWYSNTITTQDLVRFLMDKAAPECMMLPLKVGEKIAQGIESGKLKVEGLPAWPGVADKVACLHWLITALKNDSFREKLAAADKQWLTEELAFNAEEVEYAHTTLLKYAQALTSFPVEGTPEDWMKALKTMPGLSEIVTRADFSLNDNLGGVGSFLQDNTTLSRLGGMLTASGTTGKAWEALKLLDAGKSLTALRNISIQALQKTFGVTVDAAKAIWLVLKKGNDFRLSPYSAGQSLNDPVRLYRDVISFIKEDVKNNPEDYKNATIETLLATVAVVLKSFGGNHVPINWSGNTAEWLKAYAEADPAKLTAVDKVLMHAVLEPRAVLEIKRAIQQKDNVQARKLLEPLSDALKSYVGDSPILRQIAGVLPYIPAMNKAWNEIQSMELSERKALGRQLCKQVVLHTEILGNSLNAISPETLASRQKIVLALQEKLIILQNKCETGTGLVGALQIELDAMKVAVKTQPDEIRKRLTEELDLAQTALNNLKNPDVLKGMPKEAVARMYAAQATLHQDIRNTLSKEGVSSATLMQAQLQEMTRTLDALPLELRLSDMGSVAQFAEEALTRLLTSTDPQLVNVKAELDTLMRKAASDWLNDVVSWGGNQMMKLFTKEVELTPEEKEQGIFVIERDLTLGQLATGAAAGAASGALLSAMFLLLSGEGVPGLKGGKEKLRKMITHRTTPESATGTGGVNAASGPQTARLSPSYASVSGTTPQPLSRESNNLKKWLMLALPVVACAAAGAGIAAAVKPAIREKKSETGDESNSFLTQAGTLSTFIDENGIEQGIIISPEEHDSYTLAEKSASTEPLSRPKRSFMLSAMKRRITTMAPKAPTPVTQTDSTDHVEKTRRSLPAAKIKTAMNEYYQKIEAGMLARLGPDLNAVAYIDKYIIDVIKNYPQQDGGLTPDTKIRLEKQNIGAFEGNSSYYTLRELVQGKVNYNEFKVHWPKNTSEQLQDKLLPGTSRLRQTPDRGVMDQFNLDMNRNKSNPEFKENLKSFYKLSFASTASELKASRTIPAEFKALLGSCADGTLQPKAISFRNEALTEVVALRVGQKILAWNASGDHILFNDSSQGRGTEKVKKWITNHLQAETQNSVTAAKFGDIRTFNRMRGADDIQSPLTLTDQADISEHTYNTVITRMEKDMDSRVRTKGERMIDSLIDSTALALNFAVTFAPGCGIAAVLIKSLVRFGITLLKGEAKSLNADTYEEKTRFTEKALKQGLKGLMLDGVSLGTKLVETHYLKGDVPFLAPQVGRGVNILENRVPAYVKELRERTNS
ncbi:hypothetical protein PUG81_17640 [Erwiniaceae bacterium L1_54_6]|nr:hypothetical protein [Erwiniaceae bacterium L1_54_6]